MSKTTTEMQLVDINKLIPYVNNARTHNAQQINKLRSSLREFGFINPVIIDRDFNVIAGHGRIMAAKEEGINSAACDGVRHIGTQLSVGSTRINIGAACPVTKGIDLCIRIIAHEVIAVSIALADDQTIAVQNVFSVRSVLFINRMCNFGQLFLFLCQRRTLKNTIVTAAQ